MINAAIQLSDNTKKALIVIFLVLIVFFVVVGYISLAVQNFMKKQGSKADGMLANVVKAEIFDNERKFKKFAFKKNARVFYLEARIPFLIILISWGAYLIFCLFTKKWGYNPLNKTDGFATLFFEFGNWPHEKFFGINLVSGWPEIIRTPRLVGQAWFSYLFVPANAIGIVWFLICTQGFIARSLRIRKIARGVYRKNLVDDSQPNLVPPEQ